MEMNGRGSNHFFIEMKNNEIMENNYIVTIDDLSNDETIETLIIKSITENKNLIFTNEVIKHFWQNGCKSKYWWSLAQCYCKLHHLL